MKGIIGKKLGMTSIFDSERRAVACTAIECGPCVVTQIKTVEKDGYSAVQIGYAEKKEKNTPNPMKGHFKKANTTPKRVLREFEAGDATYNLGDTVSCSIVNEGAKISVVGTTKGKGFQGVVKRHGFAGVGGQTHGQHNRLRAPGSMGACSFPSRVFKGKRLGGRMGNDRVKMQGLKVLKVMANENVILVSGSVPGAIGSIVMIEL